MHKWRYMLGVVLGIALSGVLYAGTTGKIVGKVVDKQTGEPLPGAGVIIQETGQGTATDIDGSYILLNVRPGTYTLKASYIGYRDQVVEGVEVKADLTTEVNFYLSPAALVESTVVVKSTRKLVEKTATTTERRMSSRDIENLPYTDFQAAINMQAGVTGVNIIRGGRTDEVAYYIDGMQVTSPIFGSYYSNLNTSAIQEMSLITGGFNAEYGQALSGVINVVTKEGGPKYEGSFTYRTDAIMPTSLNYGQHFLDISQGGPIPGLKKYLRYFISGYAHVRDGRRAYNYQPEYPIVSAYENGTDEFRAFIDTAEVWWYDSTVPYLPRYYRELLDTARYWQKWYKDHSYMLPHTGEQEYRLQGKLTFLPAKNVKVLLSGFISRDQWDSYDQMYKYRLFRYRSSLRRQNQVTLTVNHILKNNLFYTLNIGRFYEYFRYGIKDPNYEQERSKDFFSNFIKDYRFIPCAAATPEHPEYYYRYSYTPNNPWGIADQSYVNFRGVGDYRVYHGQSTITNSFKWDLTWQATKHHEFKTGVEIRAHELKYYNNSLPWDPNPFLSYFGDSVYTGRGLAALEPVKPIQGAYYIQDKMEFEGLVVNAGLRFDYVNPKYHYYIDASQIKPDSLLQIDPSTAEPIATKPKYQLSPRLGISHPITERQVLHFAYGYFFQTPPLLYFYDGTNNTPIQLAQRGNNIVGNPNLNAEKQIAYEAGVSTQIGQYSAFDVTAFYKDIYRWVGTREVLAAPNPFYMYVNADYGNVKGLELTYQYSAPRLSYRLAYTLQYAEGTASDPFESYLNSYYGFYGLDPRTGQPLPVPHNTIPLSYDIRHTINAQVSYTTPHNFGPAGIFGDLTMSLIQRSHSGTPYTRRDARGNIIGNVNSERIPWFHRTDLTLSKRVKVKGLRFRLSLEVFNLFNKKNVLSVYSTTGLPDRSVAREVITESMFGQDTLRIGDIGYNPLRDLNGDGELTPHEMYESYLKALADYEDNPDNYGAPRAVRLGIALEF